MLSVCTHRSTHTNTQTNVHVQKLFKVLHIKRNEKKKKRINKNSHAYLKHPVQEQSLSAGLEL